MPCMLQLVCRKSCMLKHNNDTTNLTLMSVLTPGGCWAHSMAYVETLSTIVAVRPPCRVPPLLQSPSSTGSSHDILPVSHADTTVS